MPRFIGKYVKASNAEMIINISVKYDDFVGLSHKLEVLLMLGLIDSETHDHFLNIKTESTNEKN